jgi:SWI/SNF-related matrix-associated actin-dependent regulator of chromatin subfamily A-like protein 1
MIQIRHYGRHTWGIWSSGFSNPLRNHAKATPGLTWDPIERAWVGYADAVAVAIKRMRAIGLRIQGNPGGPLGEPIMPVASKGLRDYQVTGVRFLIAKAPEGCILADALGLGKTIEAIVAARALKQKTVVVCPNVVRGVWDAELSKWWKDARVLGLSGTKPDLGLFGIGNTPDGLSITDSYNQIDVVVIHYDILYAWVDAILAWSPKTLIIDEGHYLMGTKSRRTKAMTQLAGACPFRMMLTGTPMTSRPIDLWSPVHIISEGRFGKFFSYGIRYANGHQEQVTPTKTVWKFDGSSNLDELNERMNYTEETPWGFMLRRLKSDVALELPARTRQIITLEIAKSFIRTPSAALRSDRLLRQALDSAADGKFPQVIDLVIGHLEGGAKVVVGSHRRHIAQLIADNVRQRTPWKVEVITGETPRAKRDAIIKSQPDLICCTLDSTSVGINLSYASVGVIAELVWVPSTLIQWEGRFGRHEGKNILIQYCIAKNSVDALVKSAILKKLDSFTEAVGRTDDRLKDDFKQLEGGGAAERMRLLYEKLKADDD